MNESLRHYERELWEVGASRVAAGIRYWDALPPEVQEANVTRVQACSEKGEPLTRPDGSPVEVSVSPSSKWWREAVPAFQGRAQQLADRAPDVKYREHFVAARNEWQRAIEKCDEKLAVSLVQGPMRKAIAGVIADLSIASVFSLGWVVEGLEIIRREVPAVALRLAAGRGRSGPFPKGVGSAARETLRDYMLYKAIDPKLPKHSLAKMRQRLWPAVNAMRRAGDRLLSSDLLSKLGSLRALLDGRVQGVEEHSTERVEYQYQHRNIDSALQHVNHASTLADEDGQLDSAASAVVSILLVRHRLEVDRRN